MLALVDVEIINQEQVLQSLFILKWTIKNNSKTNEIRKKILKIQVEILLSRNL